MHMTFDELEQSLPNGFHDAAIREITVDFIRRSVTVSIDLLTGHPSSPDPESYRAGRLQIAPIYLFFIEPPDPRYSFIPNGAHVKVDGGCVKVGQSAETDSLLPVLPRSATMYRFFLEKWNAFLYLAGESVEFSWDDGGELI